MKILALDIETAPKQAFTWGLYNQNISLNQLIKPGEMLSWGAKWVGTPNTNAHYFEGYRHEHLANQHQHQHQHPNDWLYRLHALLCEADAVLGHNVKAFDLKHIRTEFVRHNLPPFPTPTVIDTLTLARRNFKFDSNKLDFLTGLLLNRNKVKHEGFDMWVGCMNNDPKAWAKMLRYQKQDVLLLEPLYNTLRAWDNPYNHALRNSNALCPRCGTTNPKHQPQRRGFLYTQASKKQRWQCTNPKCKGWFTTRLERPNVPN